LTTKGIKILYLSLYSLLIRRYGINNSVTRKELHCELGKHFIVPKPLRDAVIYELKDLNILDKIERNKYIILNDKKYYNKMVSN